MTALVPNGKQQFCDSAGVPLALGSVYFYVPGTTTLKDTWQDNGQAAKNANPVPLDAAGRAAIYGVGDYRQIVQDKNGNTIWDQVCSAPPAVADLNSATTGIATLNGQVAGLTTTQTTQASLIASHTSSIAALKSTSSTGGTLYYPTYAALVAAFAPYNAATAYAKGATLVDQGIAWVNILASTGTAPPTLPATSNASWQVFRNPLIGQAFSVAVTDTGTHTDPVVGGTVNNAGVFAWATGTAGTGPQYLFANDAALAKGYSDSASASATTALAQVPLVNAAGATQVAAVNAAAASGLSGLSIALPLFDDALSGITSDIQPSGVARNADGTSTNAGSLAWTLYVTDQGAGAKNLPVRILAAVTANKAVTFGIKLKSGTLSFCRLEEYPSGTQTTMPLTGGAYQITKQLVSGTTYVRIYCTSSDSAICYDPYVVVGPAAAPRRDPLLLSQEAYESTVLNRAAGEPVPFIPGFTGTAFTVPISAVNNSLPLFSAFRAFASGEKFTLFFTSNIQPDQGGTSQFNFINMFGPSQQSSKSYSVEKIGFNRYRAVFEATPVTAGKVFQGISIQFVNSAGPLVLQISDLALFRGDVWPAQQEATPAAKQLLRTSIQAETALGTFTKQSYIFSDSSKDPYSFLLEGQPLDYWIKQLGGSRIRVTNLAASGAKSAQFLSAADLTVCNVDVVGGVIPADGSEFQLANWTVDPITLNGMNNPQNTREFSLDGVDCVFTTTSTWGGTTGCNPVTLYAKTVTTYPFSRTIPTQSRLILKQGRMSANANAFTFVSTGSVNGNNPGGAIDVYNAVLASRCVGLSTTEIARVMARFAFCIELQGAQLSVPATQNTDQSGAAPYTGFPAGTVWDMNAPQGAVGTGTGGGANREYLSAAEKTFLVATGLYTLPTGGSTNDLVQKKGYRDASLSRSVSSGDPYHPNDAMQALMGYRHFYSPQFRAWWQA